MEIIRLLKIALCISGILVLLASCSPITVSPYSPIQIAAVVISSQADEALSRSLNYGSDDFEDYLASAYKIEAGILEDGTICYADGMNAGEIAILLLADGADAEKTKAALAQYIKRRAASFAGYAPKQAWIAENGVVAVRGRYVALLISGDTQNAESAFKSCFGDNPPSLPDISLLPYATEKEKEPLSPAIGSYEEPEEDADTGDLYDSEAVLAAWVSGDGSVLTVKNRKILDACAEIIALIIKDGMTDYEKELAIHDWIVKWADYDEKAVSNAPDAQPGADGANPYGLLIQRKATCKGYSSTFQLFMDLLGIECITVDGTSGDGEEAHSWNMVRLEGEWYCVDVTWDDPVGLLNPESPVSHEYFNVTSRFMRKNDHQWDEDATPEAAATRFAYKIRR